LGVVTKAVPHEDLDAEVEGLVEKLLDKNMTALQFNKKVLNHCLPGITWEDSRDFEMGQTHILNDYQNQEWRNEGLKRFQEGEYKPGLEFYKEGD
jgi:1,4-dihydroxy-2-naphthoyl-CoA synthase